MARGAAGGHVTTARWSGAEAGDPVSGGGAHSRLALHAVCTAAAATRGATAAAAVGAAAAAAVSAAAAAAAASATFGATCVGSPAVSLRASLVT